MRKRFIAAAVSLVLAFAPVSLYAASLDEVINQNEQSVEADDNSVINDSSVNNGNNVNNSGSVVDIVEQYSDMSQQNEITSKIVSPMYKVASIFVQIIFYIITLFLPVSVLADLGFLVIPFFRTGGQKSNMLTNNQNNQYQGGYGNGIGNRGYGNNAYGNAYGNGAYGNNSYNNNAGQKPIMEDKFLCIKVSENVIAIASSQVSTVDKLQEYTKDAIAKVVFSAVIALLLITGVLTRLALLIGNSVGNAVSNMGGML